MNSLACSLLIIIISLQVSAIIQAKNNRKRLRDGFDARLVILENWLFKSLYSMNHKVVLPDEAPLETKLAPTKKARVYSHSEDPMYEFSTGLDEI